MMQFGFNGYEGFKELFVREDGRRKNGVLLSFWKNRKVREWARATGHLKKILRVGNMGELFSVCDFLVRETYPPRLYSVDVMGKRYCSDKYSSDGHGGVCEDGDFTSFRYVNKERGDTVFKMKIGKMYKHLILCSEFGRILNEQVILFMCEEMARKWQAENAQKCSGFQLHVDDDFEKIYSSRFMRGNFGSCMTDEDRHSFYSDAVAAKAAYLTDENGLIVARCVIYLGCTDEDGKVWRLAERQYSSGGDETLKLMLVYSLIKGGYIDGYKKVGADCHSPMSFLDIHDNPIPNPKFWIKCNLAENDILSYQDSFKSYCGVNKKAYNWDSSDIQRYYDLSTTDRYLGGSNYDSWNEEYTTDDIVTVYYHGEEYTCSENDLNDFYYIDDIGEYHHYQDVSRCDRCGNYFLNDSAHHSELTERDYCSADCLDFGEASWKEDNWEYAEYDDEYAESVEVFYRAVNSTRTYIDTTITKESLRELISDGDVEEYNGEYYEVSDFLGEYLAESN